jgi:ABC-type cobalamin transport system permease subunit
MANSKIYLTLLIVGFLAAIGGILMRVSGNPPLHEPGTILGWSGIVLVLVARIVFGRKRRSAAPPAGK